MRNLHALFDCAVLAVAPIALGEHQATLEAGDEHTYRIHVESERDFDLGMGMEREEQVTFDGRFDLLVQEVTEAGARVQLVWREVEAIPAGTVAGTPVDEATVQAWADAGATLVDKDLEMFVLPTGRITGIEGLMQLTPPRDAQVAFDRVFNEADMIALLQGVFTPTGKQHAVRGMGVLACDLEAAGQKNKNGEVLEGEAVLAIPDDVRSFPGLAPGEGEATGAMEWHEDEARLASRTVEASATIHKEGPPLTATIEATSVLELERTR